MTLGMRIAELVAQHGSLRAAARAVKMDAGYLSRLQNGSKREPSDAVLKKLGLRRLVDYGRVVVKVPTAAAARLSETESGGTIRARTADLPRKKPHFIDFDESGGRHCDQCDPSFACFDGSVHCCKTPDPAATDEAREEVEYIIVKLRQRVLAKHGGTAEPFRHHTNLTEGDSVMHREAAHVIEGLTKGLAAVEVDTALKEPRHV